MPLSSPIVPGDLVICTNCHCPGNERFLGRIFTVSRIKRMDAKCNACGQDWGERVLALGDGDNGFLLQWLRKIEPLPDERQVERQAELSL